MNLPRAHEAMLRGRVGAVADRGHGAVLGSHADDRSFPGSLNGILQMKRTWCEKQDLRAFVASREGRAFPGFVMLPKGLFLGRDNSTAGKEATP
jgi:hypothetical protein